VAVIAVAVVLAAPVGASAALRARRGAIAADVTMRSWPSTDAPAVRDLVAGDDVVVRGRWRRWMHVVAPDRGWIPTDSFAEGEATAGGDTSAETGGQAAAPAQSQERTEADLMFDALNESRGQTPNAARIERVMAEAKVHSAHEAAVRRNRIAALYWKDPWAQDPNRPIPVRREDRQAVAARKEALDARREALHSRSTTATLRAQLAAARAETAQARAEAARAQAAAAQAEADAARRVADGCGESTPPPATAAGEHVRRRHHHRAELVASASDPVSGSRRTRHRVHATEAPAPTPAPAAAEEPAPTTDPAAAPGSWSSTDTRGIVIVPINRAQP
jgi:hypothetical protein